MKEYQSLGKELAEKLQGVEDEATIKQLCDEVFGYISNTTDKPGTFKNRMVAVRNEIKAAFPDTEKQEHPYQSFTNSGKGNIPRYEHLAFKYLPTGKDEKTIEAVKNSSNELTFEELTVMCNEEINQIGEKLTELDNKDIIVTQHPVDAVEASLPTLDDDTQKLVDEAIFSSGQSFNEFYQNAMKAYANSLLAKKRQTEDDLSNISTQELLSNPKYKTHSGRVQELTNRAVQAIIDYNDNCTEKSQKWLITQSIIQSLIKSRPSAIKESLECWKQRIEDHHHKQELTNLLHNRSQKSEIGDVIKLPEFGSN